MDSATTAAWEADDEWELYNDDGFVYKRKKRRLDPAAAQTQPGPEPAADPYAEERHRREWKRKTLLNLKSQYQREIDHWELLSNTLRAMEGKGRTFQQQQREQDREETMSVRGSPSRVVQGNEDGCGSLVNELILQAEAQEEIIRDVSNLCDVAEAMCNAQEELFKQSLIDLPIWASPRELMESLCDDSG